MSKILIDEATVKLALDAMQRIQDADMDCDFLNIRQADQLEEAITALRKARAAQPAQRTWVGLMRGVRVEGDTVVITAKGGNDAARELCGALLEEKNT